VQYKNAKKMRRLILIFCGAVLLQGCGQKPSSESRAERPNNASSPSAGTGQRYDLWRDEERGGHTLRKHVGRTDDELRQRLERERNISAASTWTDRGAAEETVAAALQAERGKIENWQRRGERRPNLALHFDVGHEIGRSLVRGATEVVPCTEAVIVLRADGEAFYVLTTYPETR
jgi:toxin YxiD